MVSVRIKGEVTNYQRYFSLIAGIGRNRNDKPTPPPFHSTQSSDPSEFRNLLCCTGIVAMERGFSFYFLEFALVLDVFVDAF